MWFFSNSSLRDFQVGYLTLFHLVLVIDSLEFIWMGRPCKNIQVILEFFEAAALVQHFSFYTIMTHLIMLSVILLSVLMIQLQGFSQVLRAWGDLKGGGGGGLESVHGGSMEVELQTLLLKSRWNPWNVHVKEFIC